MIGMLFVNQREHRLAEAELLLPLDGGTRWMYLFVSGEDPHVGFGMWDVELVLLTADLNRLDGQRIHVRPDYATCDDDTLGTDISQMYETTDINYLRAGDEFYSFGEIQVDFHRIDGNTYRCRFSATLTDEEPAELREMPESAFKDRATAEFIVTVEERRPGGRPLGSGK